MSEMKRGWWKERAFDTSMGYRSFPICPEKMQQIRDLFDFAERLSDGQRVDFIVSERDEILNRGTPPEPESKSMSCEAAIREVHDYLDSVRDAGGYAPGQIDVVKAILDCVPPKAPPKPEWLPVGVAPDREGVWEVDEVVCNSPIMLSTIHRGKALVRCDEPHGLVLCWVGWRAPVTLLDSSRFRFRRIGDLR